MDNVSSLTPGDKVTITSAATRFGHGHPVGAVVVVVTVDTSDNSVDTLSDDYAQWVGAEDIEPLGITHEITWPELPADEQYALSDCAWYDNRYQPWARLDCSGRMALVTMLNGGHLVTSATMCEAHVNAYPASF